MNQSPFGPSENNPLENQNPTPHVPESAPMPNIPEEVSAPEEKNPFFVERPYDTRPEGFYDPARTPHADPTPGPQAPNFAPQATSYTYVPPQPPKPKKKLRGGVIALLCAVLFLLGIGAGVALYRGLQPPTFTPQDKPVQGQEGSLNELPEGELSGGVFAPVYGDAEETYNPAKIYAESVNGVVGITTELITQNVFGQQIPQAVSGTGFVFSADGYILTNAHVVENASNITVSMYDGTEYEAGVVGLDTQNDVAVLKIAPQGELTVLSMGKSADMVVGEEILVIGNPLGELTYTMTRGIISNLSREITVEDNLTTIRMFQTDAAINHGNSGGPAINCHGNVIGIVSAKYSSSSIEGLGFCIPIDDALKIARDLIEHGYVQGRAYLGIEGQAVSGYSGNTYIAGVRITAVLEGSCAQKAGLQKGDIIVKFADEDVTTIAELKGMLSSYQAGDSTELTVYRNREYVFVSIVLDEAKN